MIKKILNTKFKKDLSFSYITQSFNVLLGFLQLFIINRYYGIEVFGQLTIIISIVGIIGIILTARSSEAVTKFLKREELRKNYMNAKFVLFTGFVVDFFTAILIVIIIYFSTDMISMYFLKNDNLTEEIKLYSFIAFFGFLKGTFRGLFQSRNKFTIINSFIVLESFFKVIFLLIFVFILDKIFLIDIIYAFLYSSIIIYILNIIAFFRLYLVDYFSVKLVFNRSLLSEYFVFNMKTFISSSLKAGMTNIDNLILSYFFTVQIVGIYQLIKKILSPILIISSPFSMLIYPKLLVYFEKKELMKLRKTIINISVVILFISLIYSIICFFMLEFLFNILNVEFYKIYTFYYLIISMIIILTSQSWWTRIFSNTVNPNFALYVNSFSLVFQLTITILLTKVFGIFGMLGSVLLMYLLIYMYYFFKMNGLKI